MTRVESPSSTPIPPRTVERAEKAESKPRPTGFSSEDRFEKSVRRTDAPARSSVIVGDVTIKSAADLEALKGVTRITGTLTIEGDIASLEGLEKLVGVGGLVIKSSKLSSLDGLDGLKTVTGDVKIERNAELESLGALKGLEKIGGDLSIGAVVSHGDDGFITDVKDRGNPKLKSLGLDGLRSVGGDLSIACNPALTQLGLGELREVRGQLDVLFSPKLSEVSLPKLESVAHLQIGHYPLVDSASAGKYVLFPAGNDALTRVDLPKLARADSVVVTDNNALRDVELTSLGAGGQAIGSLVVSTNPLLERVSAPSLEVVGALNISQSAGIKIKDADGKLLYDPPIGGALNTIELPRLREAGELAIHKVPSLESLELPALERVTRDLFLENAPKLSRLHAPRLADVGGILRVGDLGALTRLDGLGALERVGALYLDELPALESLDGLAKLRAIGSELRISWTGVTDDQARAWIAAIGHRGPVTLEGNRGSEL